MAWSRAPPPLPACLGPPSSAENGHAEAGPFGLAHTSTRLTPEHGDPEAGDPEACVPRKDPESEGVAVGAAHTERERKGGGGEADTIYKKMGCLPHLQRSLKMPSAVASQGQVPLGSRKQDSWARTSDSEHPSPAPTPGPHSRGPCWR